MPICDERRLVFVHIPKNAGTAVETSLRMRSTGHKRWSDYRDMYPREWGEYRSFAIVRDPVARFVSCFRYAKMRRSYWHSAVPGEVALYGQHPDFSTLVDISFAEFVDQYRTGKVILQHPGWLPQSHWVTHNGEVQVDHIINYSDLEAGLLSLGIRNISRVNVTNDIETISPTDREAEIIRTIYAEDCKLFRL